MLPSLHRWHGFVAGWVGLALVTAAQAEEHPEVEEVQRAQAQHDLADLGTEYINQLHGGFNGAIHLEGVDHKPEVDQVEAHQQELVDTLAEHFVVPKHFVEVLKYCSTSQI